MKNHELLDLIGDVDEGYVLSAGNNVTRPRFRWKGWAAAAACAALVLAAYPAYRAFHPPLHDYTVVEGGGTLTAQDDVKAPAGGQIDVPGQEAPAQPPDMGPAPDPGTVYAPDPNTLPGGACVGGEGGDGVGYDGGQEGLDGAYYHVPGQDAPSQEAAIAQYWGLLRGLGGQGGGEPETYPDWFAGSWIDNSYQPEARLAVAIVDGLRTTELEARIEGWCGGEVVFTDASYSLEHLNGLMDRAVETIQGAGLSCGVGVDVEANCLGVDLYSLSGGPVPDRVLAALARLDPAGDAIRVRVFVETLSLADDVGKGPAPDRPAPDPVDPEARATPIDGSEPVRGGKTEPAPGAVQEKGATEAGQAAVYDLPEPRQAAQPAPGPAGYDIIYGAGE